MYMQAKSDSSDEIILYFFPPAFNFERKRIKGVRNRLIVGESMLCQYAFKFSISTIQCWLLDTKESKQHADLQLQHGLASSW